MDNFIQAAKQHLKDVRIDNEDLTVFSLDIIKDPRRSRVVVKIESEIGIDFPGDLVEDALVQLYQILPALFGKPGK